MQTSDAVAAILHEHITATNQVVGTSGVEDGLGIDGRRHLEGDTRREVGLDSTSDDIGGRTLRGDNQVDANGAGELCDTRKWFFHFLTGGHDEVGKLVDYHYYIRQELVSALRIETTSDELGVVFLDVAALRLFEQVVAVVHLHGERIEGLLHLLDVGDDGVFALRKFGEVVLLYLFIKRELHLLGVNEHKLDLRGMFFVKYRRDDGIETHRLTLTSSTSDKQVRTFGKVDDVTLVADGLADGEREFVFAVLESRRRYQRFHRNNLRVLVGDFDTDSAASGDWRDDSDTSSLQVHHDVVLEALDF